MLVLILRCIEGFLGVGFVVTLKTAAVSSPTGVGFGQRDYLITFDSIEWFFRENLLIMFLLEGLQFRRLIGTEVLMLNSGLNGVGSTLQGNTAVNSHQHSNKRIGRLNHFSSMPLRKWKRVRESRKQIVGALAARERRCQVERCVLAALSTPNRTTIPDMFTSILTLSFIPATVRDLTRICEIDWTLLE